MANLKDDARRMAAELKKKTDMNSVEYKDTEKVNMN